MSKHSTEMRWCFIREDETSIHGRPTITDLISEAERLLVIEDDEDFIECLARDCRMQNIENLKKFIAMVEKRDCK